MQSLASHPGPKKQASFDRREKIDWHVHALRVPRAPAYEPDTRLAEGVGLRETVCHKQVCTAGVAKVRTLGNSFPAFAVPVPYPVSCEGVLLKFFSRL